MKYEYALTLLMAQCKVSISSAVHEHIVCVCNNETYISRPNHL